MLRDENGRILEINDNTGRLVSYRYDSKGNLATFTDRENNRWNYQYSQDNRLTHVVDPSGLTTLDVTYDNQGRVSRSKTGGSTTRYTYKGNETQVREDNENSIGLFFVQSELGVTTSITNREGHTSSLELDTENRVVSLLSDRGIVVNISYDDQGNIEALSRISNTNQNSPERENFYYKYDATNRLTSVSSESDRIFRFSYNTAGNVSSITENGTTRSYAYNEFGDVVQEKVNGISTFMDYDENGLLVAISKNGRSAFLTYNAEGALMTAEFPDGNTHVYQRGPLGFRTSVQRSDSSWQSYDYNLLGQLIATQGHHPEIGLHGQQYTFDEFNRIVSVESTDDSLQVTYDAKGNPQTISRNDSQVSYEYDGRGRLISVEDSIKGSSRYAYTGNETDLRRQFDERTPVSHPGLIRVSHNRLSLQEVLYARVAGLPYQLIGWNENAGILSLSSEIGVVKPGTTYQLINERRRLNELFGTSDSDQRKFDTASSSFYLPPEYASANCVLGCYMGPLLLSKPSRIVAGGDAVFMAWPGNEGPECNGPLYSWFVDGVLKRSGSSGIFIYSFPGQGTYTVSVIAECRCDSARKAKFVTVNVLHQCAELPNGTQFGSSCCYNGGTVPNSPISNLGQCPSRVNSTPPATNGCTGPPDNPNLIPPSPGCFAPRTTNPNRPTFVSACNSHDICYSTCGSLKGGCDKSFESDLYAICATVPQLGCKAYCLRNASIYAIAVNLVGQRFYDKSQKSHCNCCF